MTEEGMNSLLSNELTLGGNASVAAGPVGREAAAATDATFDAQILSYSRSKGLFAGLALQGSVVRPDEDEMRDVYGSAVTTKTVLKDARAKAPDAVQVFPKTLAQYSTRRLSSP